MSELCPEKKQIRLSWKSKLTNASGHGRWRKDTEKNRGVLKAAVSIGSANYPEITHWIEERNLN